MYQHLFTDFRKQPSQFPVTPCFSFKSIDDQQPPFTSQALAQFAVAALERPYLVGQTFSIGGNLISASEMGEVLSAKLSRSTTFVSISPEDFERQLRPVFGDTAEKIADSYRFTQDHAALYESINMDETYIMPSCQAAYI